MARWLVLCLITAATAAHGMAPRSSPPADQVLDEVVIRAQKLYELRSAIEQAEDRFYARYNELNRRNEFDIQCEHKPRTGSSRNVRRCYPRVVAAAQADEADAFFEMMLANEAMAPGGSLARPRSAPSSDVQARFPEYQQNMLRLLKQYPELRRLVREQERLQRRYDEIGRQR